VPPLKGKITDLKGRRFGNLTVLYITQKRQAGKRIWMCQCDCGTQLTVRHDYLLHTNHPKTHCGCMNKGLPTQYSQEYHIHNSMLRRCYVKDHVGYPHYGARGIQVCEQWRDKEKGFEQFLKDMGERPTPRHTLDRINPDGNYEPGNVRWATMKHQNRNKRRSLYLPHPETKEMVPAAEVAEYLEITYQQLRARLMREGKWPA
jgi:hypothetical protein